MSGSAPRSEAPKEEPQKKHGRHLRIVTTEDTIPMLPDEDVIEEPKAVPPPIPEEALRKKGPTMVERAEAHFAQATAEADAEKRVMGAAKALGREAQAIREAQAKLAEAAVDELVAEQEAEERANEPLPQGTMKHVPAAKPASLLDRLKGWFRR